MFKGVFFTILMLLQITLSANDNLLDTLSKVKKSPKWQLQTKITHHLNPLLNQLDQSACITCGMDQALGIVGEFQYKSSDVFSIGIKATLINPNYQNQINTEAIFKKMELSNLSIVCTLSL